MVLLQALAASEAVRAGWVHGFTVKTAQSTENSLAVDYRAKAPRRSKGHGQHVVHNRIESESIRSQRRARLIHHVPRLESHAHRRVPDFAGKLHFGLVSSDYGSAGGGGFGKEKDGALDQSHRILFIDDMSGRNFIFALFHLKKRVALEKLFVMLSEGGHVLHSHDNLILVLRLTRIFVNVHVFAVQNGLASRGSAPHARRLPVNLDVHLLRVLAGTSRSSTRWACTRCLPSGAAAAPLLG